MSYAASLLTTYPSSYGPSTLLSDDLVQRSTFANLYQSSVPYMSNGRLLNDDLAFDQINYDTTYHPSLYSISNPTSHYPTTNYQKTLITNQRQSFLPNNSYTSLNDITEYSDSLATASNTNTASSAARSINGINTDGPMNMFLNYPQHSNDINNNPQRQSIWNSPPTKQKGQSDKIKPKPTTLTQPSISIQKKSSPVELDDDLTPVQSPHPRMASTKHSNTTINDINRQSPSIDIQAWVNDTKKASPVDEKAAEEAWSVKMGQLHQVKAQRVKEKAKSTRALPIPPKKVDNKSLTNKSKSITDTKSLETTYEPPYDTYLDSLFDGDFFRTTTNNYPLSLPHQQPTNKIQTNPFNDSISNNVSKNPKNIPPRKTTRYEPPSTKRVPPPPTTTNTTNTSKKQAPKQHNSDPVHPYYPHNDFTQRDMPHKDTDERFREALQKLRQDRAEQQHKEINEKTAKRLDYGNYVRHSTKDALLQNAVKPSPWSDFMHLKKGNLYSLFREERKHLYDQSKSYGERIRYRNFAIHNGGETTRSQRHSVPLLDDVEEPEADNATPRQNRSKSISRPNSALTNKSHTKQTEGRTGGNRIIPNQTSRTNRRSNAEHEYPSDHDTNRRFKHPHPQKNVRYAKFDSSGRNTSGTEESENELDNHPQRNTRDINDDLFTVREEKTMESIEGVRYKKR